MGEQRKAADATIKELEAAGRVNPVDATLIARVRGLADAVDGDPDKAALWEQYAKACLELASLAVDPKDEALARAEALLDKLRTL